MNYKELIKVWVIEKVSGICCFNLGLIHIIFPQKQYVNLWVRYNYNVIWIDTTTMCWHYI